MEEYYNMAAQEDEDLAPLWEQWSEVQAEMICLTVEVLGEHNIDVGQHNLSDRLTKGISDADIKHRGNENRYIEAEQSMVDIKADLVTLCDETAETVKAQQKASQVSCLTLLPSLTSVLADLESGAQQDAGQHQASYGRFREEQMKESRWLRSFDIPTHVLRRLVTFLVIRTYAETAGGIADYLN